jgi:hypothetical protein
MPHLTLDQIRAEAARLEGDVGDVCRRLEMLHGTVDRDVGEASEEMRDWLVEPTPSFYLHGCLETALELLQDSLDPLHRAAAATPEAIRKAWLAKRAERRSQRSEGPL